MLFSDLIAYISFINFIRNEAVNHKWFTDGLRHGNNSIHNMGIFTKHCKLFVQLNMDLKRMDGWYMVQI